MVTKTGWTLWLTGLPASGKTTLAYALKHRLDEAGIATVVLDSDVLRQTLMPNANYTSQGRDEFYRQIVLLALMIAQSNVNVIIAATGHRRAYRALARERLMPFAEVWVRCSIDVCRARDPKYLYVQADTGVLDQLPGIGVPYEAPEVPDAIIDTDRHTLEEAVDLLLGTIPFIKPERVASPPEAERKIRQHQ